VNARERGRLRRRLLLGMQRVLADGGEIRADVADRSSLVQRAARCNDPSVNKLPIATLCALQGELVAAGMAIRVVVGRTVLLRPVDRWCAPIVHLASRRHSEPGQ
jgi:hypothetical protein